MAQGNALAGEKRKGGRAAEVIEPGQREDPARTQKSGKGKEKGPWVRAGREPEGGSNELEKGGLSDQRREGKWRS